MHLTPDELIDLSEGADAGDASAHVRGCETCRAEVAALQAAMSSAASVDVPEPSPLFWDHLSARVRENIAAEPAPARRWTWAAGLPMPSWSGVAVAAVAAAIGIAVYVTAPRSWLLRDTTPDSREATTELVLQPFGAADDPSLALVADLTEQLDPGAVAETGWTSHAGGVEEAVANLTDDERIELQRLLQEAMEKQGAS
jgi:hypothetical protein